jgi:hypothetical protein
LAAGVVCGWMGVAPAAAQNMLRSRAAGGPVQLLPSDAAVIETEETRKDLPCTVTPLKAVLGFDLRFHAGYGVTLPLKEISGSGDTLTMIFKVISEDNKESPAFFSQKFNVPPIDEDSKGETYLEGTFDVGEGSYHVDWMMRDRMERICSADWDVSANLTPQDQNIKPEISGKTIEAAERDFFRPDPPVSRAPTDSFRVKLLVNFAPQNAASASMPPVDTSAIVSILRNIHRDPRIGKFSLVAFNMTDQKVVYRAEDADHIDFPALGKAVNGVKLGTVSYKALTDPHSEIDFLNHLVEDELSSASTDAVIFAGPKVMLEQSVSPDVIKDLSNINFPVFYMNYNLRPQQNPWRDSIGSVVKKLKGVEYTISRPRDLANAWADIVNRMTKVKPPVAAFTSPK